jgi:hypothetical protein
MGSGGVEAQPLSTKLNTSITAAIPNNFLFAIFFSLTLATKFQIMRLVLRTSKFPKNAFAPSRTAALRCFPKISGRVSHNFLYTTPVVTVPLFAAVPAANGRFYGTLSALYGIHARTRMSV